MTAHTVTLNKSALSSAALMAWALVGLVPVVLAEESPAPATTVEEQQVSPPQDSEVQERGLQRAPIQGLQPSATVPLQLVGPTDNLTKVINALRLKHKSLTIVITTTPGLSLTQPVEISIAYISPAGPPPSGNRITQPYQRKFGNRFVYTDPEGEGTPRHMRIDMWLTEPKPGGGLYTYSISWQADLDPLYDVTISPLTFQLLSNCDFVSHSEIRFGWNAPDTARPEDYKRFSFSAFKGKRVMIQPFAWARPEVSASAHLHMPSLRWDEHDPSIPNPLDFSFPGTFDSQARISTVNLVSGKTQGYSFGLFPGQPYPGPEQIRGNTCIARIIYSITYTLHLYPSL
jgi:hypothetical protein